MPTRIRYLLHRASVLLEDTDPQFTRWTEAELVAWLNDAQKAIVKVLPQAGARSATRCGCCPARGSASLPIADTHIKPGDGSTPATRYGVQLFGFTRNMGADGLTPGRAVTAVASERLKVGSGDIALEAAAAHASGSGATAQWLDYPLGRQFTFTPHRKQAELFARSAVFYLETKR
jgi:hypothetical protein